MRNLFSFAIVDIQIQIHDILNSNNNVTLEQNLNDSAVFIIAVMNFLGIIDETDYDKKNSQSMIPFIARVLNSEVLGR